MLADREQSKWFERFGCGAPPCGGQLDRFEICRAPQNAQIHFPRTVTYRLTEGHNIEGSDQDPLTIASSPVDLPKWADVRCGEPSQYSPFDILSCGFTA
jgi:hypothetical protein